MRRIGSIAGAVLVAVAAALALGWLVQRVPALGWLLAAAAIVALTFALWRAITGERPVRTLGAMAFTYGLSIVALFGLSALLAESTSDVEDAEGAALPTTSSAAPTAPATATTTTSTTSTPATPAPATAAPVEVVTTEPPEPTTTAVAEPSLEITVVDAIDCDCTAELTGIGVRADGGAVVVDLAGPAPPDRVWLWGAEHPGRPAIVDVGDAAAIAGGWQVTVADPPGGPWAVVSADGDRVPDLGFVDDGGTTTSVVGEGEVAARLAADLATAQRAVPALDPPAAELVTSLVARQTQRAGSTFERRLEVSPDVPLAVATAVEWPALSQRVVLDGDTIQELYVTGETILLCEPVDAGPNCGETDVALPLTTAAAIARDPAALVVERLDAVPDGSHACVRVVATPEGGPSIGETCWDADGLQTRAVRVGVDTIERLTVTSDVDPTDLIPPGGP